MQTGYFSAANCNRIGLPGGEIKLKKYQGVKANDAGEFTIIHFIGTAC
jgi:hypothetical protein